ncbi:MAG: hypothetical protein HQM08_28930 [Candidatus Riflebacteria bacterium]|nr:hypothetical protein [Candidatus Riflebacteria bacterium]
MKKYLPKNKTNGLILEGLAGTGKSTLFSMLKQWRSASDLINHSVFIPEEETLGELMSELASSHKNNLNHLRRLDKIMTEISGSHDKFIFLERFHHTYYALGLDWNLLKMYDQKLAELNFKTILLGIDTVCFPTRSFRRPEFKNSSWEKDLVSHFGSEVEVIKAFEVSQERRKQALALSSISSKTINTSHKKWEQYLEFIVEFITD